MSSGCSQRASGDEESRGGASALIESISGLKRGGAYKLIRLLAKNKLVAHSSKPYDGYRLTSKGYDYLALKTLCKRGSLSAIGIQVGVGKESDIFTAVTPEGEEVALKLHKLGRSFRTLKNNRDYTRPGQSFNWRTLSLSLSEPAHPCESRAAHLGRLQA